MMGLRNNTCDGFIKEIADLKETIKAQSRENFKLKQALSFYADPFSWANDLVGHDGEWTTHVNEDSGDIARKALDEETK